VVPGVPAPELRVSHLRLSQKRLSYFCHYSKFVRISDKGDFDRACPMIRLVILPRIILKSNLNIVLTL
jgi:hypothetical protein